MSRSARVAVIGAGSWGTTVASLDRRERADGPLGAQHPTSPAEIGSSHTNERYLPGAELDPGAATATDSIEEAIATADVLVMAVPSHGFRAVLEQAAPHVRPWIPVVSLTKGLEQGTRLRMTEVIDEVLPGHPAGVLTGPNVAKEVIDGPRRGGRGRDARRAGRAVAPGDLQDAALPRLHAAPTSIGAEIAGALKNVVAIAAGMAEGLGAGDNTRALVICRSLAELTRLGVAMGGDPADLRGAGRDGRPARDLHEPARAATGTSASSWRSARRSTRSRPR